MSAIDHNPAEGADRTSRRFQFSLATLLTTVFLAACLLSLGRVIGATCTAMAVGILILALVGALYYRRTRTGLPIALSLAAAHTLLVAVAATIELGVGINDMSPSILIFVALYYVDLPITVALRGFGYDQLNLNPDGAYALLALVGAVFWFATGGIVDAVIAFARRMRNGRATDSSGADL